jgi:1,4-alpha-glucan branching enzyme
VCNMTPVPREGFRIGVPEGVSAWVERLNTDAQTYGGSGVGNKGMAVPTERIAAHGRAQSIAITVPPLATLYWVAA